MSPSNHLVYRRAHWVARIVARLPGPFPYATSQSDKGRRSPHYRWRADASWGCQGDTAATGYSRWRCLAVMKACWNVTLFAFGRHPRVRRWCFVLDEQGRPAVGRWWYDLLWWGEYLPAYQWFHASYWHFRHRVQDWRGRSRQKAAFFRRTALTK